MWPSLDRYEWNTKRTPLNFLLLFYVGGFYSQFGVFPGPVAPPVDASWGDWGSWSSCSRTCGRRGVSILSTYLNCCPCHGDELSIHSSLTGTISLAEVEPTTSLLSAAHIFNHSDSKASITFRLQSTKYHHAPDKKQNQTTIFQSLREQAKAASKKGGKCPKV